MFVVARNTGAARSLLGRTTTTTTTTTRMLTANVTSAAAVADAKPTFKNQNKLPKLPVQDLHKGLAMYLKSLEPLVTAQEYKQTEAYVQDFVKPGGLGEKLHKRLLDKAKTEPRSWFIDWWNEWAYMGYRDPIVINVSYFFQFVDDEYVKKGQTARAAAIIQSALQFRDLLNNEQIKPDMAKDTPLDMDQYRYMFNTSRRPVIPSDISTTYPSDRNQHITVIRKNKIYSLPVYPVGSSVPFTTAQIKHQLDKIVDLAGNQPQHPAIGLLTTEQRDDAAKLLQQILAVDPSNLKALEKVESSIFTVCLDDTSPITRNEVGRALWHGDGRNRFFDKSVQFIVFANGKAGMNGEHSMMDATPTSRCSEFVVESLLKNTINHGSPTASLHGLPEPELVNFKLNKDIEKSLEKAATRFDADVARHDHHVLHYNKAGKNQIKKYKMSPDAFAQMAIQLGYYRYKGKFRATYESAQVKKFTAGRTEVVRSCSADSAAWVLSMQDPKVSAQEKADKLRKAANSHVAYMNQAVDGLGCDRLILGLKFARLPGETHPFFDDKNLAESSHWYLSTSQISSEYYDGYGWGEVCSDGFGIAYMVNDNVLNFNIANLKSWATSKDMADALQSALDDMIKILDASPAASKL